MRKGEHWSKDHSKISLNNANILLVFSLKGDASISRATHVIFDVENKRSHYLTVILDQPDVIDHFPVNAYLEAIIATVDDIIVILVTIGGAYGVEPTRLGQEIHTEQRATGLDRTADNILHMFQIGLG